MYLFKLVDSIQVSIDVGGPFGTFLTYLFLFIIGSFVGWIIEVFFRRIFSMHKWINPGFLKGPCLPLYGFGLCALHLICDLCFHYMLSPSDIPYSFYNIPLSNVNGVITYLVPTGSLPFYAVSIICILIIGLAMTLIEFIAGLIFVKGMHIQLWDYSKLKGNILGVISPLFSVIWTVVGALYWFGIRPLISNLIYLMLPHMWGVTFLLGAFYALLIVDVIYSLKLSIRVSGQAIKANKIVDLERFKLNLNTKKVKESRIIDFTEQLKLSFAPVTSKLNKLARKVKSHMYINNELPTESPSLKNETPRTKFEKINKTESVKKDEESLK